MKFTFSWLKDHLKTDLGLADLAHRLTMLGLEVEDIHDSSALLAPFLIASIDRVEPHPNADRLKICWVNITGSDKELTQVVCGASNARAGLKSVFALPGTKIPLSGTVLKVGTIRGIESRGMLCSAQELGFENDSEGKIIELPHDAPLGHPYVTAYGLIDPTVTIGLTPNRGDCFGIRGIARDLAAADMGKLRGMQNYDIPEKHPLPLTVRITTEAQPACPLFMVRGIMNIHHQPTPEPIKNRLKNVGVQSIHPLVDITNYMAYDLGQPMHVFDLDAIKGSMVIDLSKGGESFHGLNDKEYILPPEIIIIRDDSGVISVPGVMGGMGTACTHTTQNVLVESAVFDMGMIARAGRLLNITSDSRTRFERGIDPHMVATALDKGVSMMMDICKGEATNVYQSNKPQFVRDPISYKVDSVKRLSGMSVSLDKMESLLKKLGFECIKGNDNIHQCIPPSWRHDIHGEEDIIEEIVRTVGYDHIPMVKPTVMLRTTESSFSREIHMKRVLTTMGLMEVVSFSFLSPKIGDWFIDKNNPQSKPLILSNPISTDLSMMRPSIIPSLLMIAQKNKNHGQKRMRIFEIGPQFIHFDIQETVAAGLFVGDQTHPSWIHQSRPTDAYDAKKVLVDLIAQGGIDESKLTITRETPAWYHPGKSGAIKLGQKVLGYFGELHPHIANEMDLTDAISMMECFIHRLPPAKQKTMTTVPSLIPLERDLAFLVNKNDDGGAVLRCVKDGHDSVLSAVLFDVYSGQGVPEGFRSMAIRITLDQGSKTLTDPEIQSIMNAVIDKTTQKTGATLRA